MHSGTDAASGIIAAACIAAFSCRSSSNTVVYVCVPVHVCVCAYVRVCVCVCKRTHVGQRVACENPNIDDRYKSSQHVMALIQLAHVRTPWHSYHSHTIDINSAKASWHSEHAWPGSMAMLRPPWHSEPLLDKHRRYRLTQRPPSNTHTHTNGYVQIQ